MVERPAPSMPKLPRHAGKMIIAGILLIVLLTSASRLLDTYVDWLWFGEVGYRDVFSTVLWTKAVLFLVVGVFVGGVVALNLTIAYRARPPFVPAGSPQDPLPEIRSGLVRRARVIVVAVPAVIGVTAGLSARGDWQTVQLFLNGQGFGVDDPEFGHDVAFYVFDLPFFRMVLSWLFIATVLGFVAALVVHYIFGGIRLVGLGSHQGRGGQGRSGYLSGAARMHLAILAGIFVLLQATAYFLDRYSLLSSDRNDLFTGASYTDLNAVLPAKIILLCIAVICAAAFFAGAVLRNLQLPAIATVLMILSAILVGAAWPAALEQFSVKPNANEKEAESIERNIAATRQAYNLDDVQYTDYPGQAEASPAEVRADTETIPNVRLLDPSILEQTFTQLQQRENFYGFPDKLDVDRYTVDGQKQDYIVAVRELVTSSLAENQRSWINRHLTYTHGNGFVAAPANTVNSALTDSSGEGGYPIFTVSDTTTQGAIEVKQPRVYFGELIDNYTIVGGAEGAPPREYDSQGQNYTYTGEGGVEMGSWFKRLVFAVHHGERNILFNDAIGSDSKIIYNQDPRVRVEKVAPWLTADGDPYPAVIDGRIKWIVDGYTTLENYPYAQRTSLGDATTDTLAGVQRLPDDEISYIRDSVKAIVDAYDGTVDLYAFDESDPVLQTWMKIFPDTVKPASEISDSLREHFRYPQDFFKVQRQMLTRYHVDDPGVFYGTNDFWDVPDDPTQGQLRADQPAYYVLAGPPTEAGPAEFQLTSALVSLRRQFLSAYVSVGSEPENYGEIRVLKLPTDSQTLGPQQVQTRFESSAEVSQELNLLRRQGATEVRFGNLLTLPIGDGGLLYVEPVYVERTRQDVSFPQLNRVLVAYGDRIGYAPTLREALNEVFGAGAGDLSTAPEDQADEPLSPPPTPPTPEPVAPDPVPPASGAVSSEVSAALSDVRAALDELRSAQIRGDFAAQGQAMARLEQAARRFDAANAPGPGGG